VYSARFAGLRIAAGIWQLHGLMSAPLCRIPVTRESSLNPCGSLRRALFYGGSTYRVLGC